MAESASSQNLPSTSKQQPSHEKICLETHTWHEKRFHMINKWEYRIPYCSKDKNLQANYNAVTKNCLLQDISYYTCIEIVGEKNLLEATLKEHCNPKKNFTAKMYTNGQREGTVMFFKKNGYPQFPIGNVNFFWKLSETNIKTIWIWVHPAFYSDFLSEIISSFEFKQNAEQDRTDISYNLNDLYTNDAGCEMRVLKYALNRFRLSGPTALTVLKEALRVPSLTELGSENCPMTEEQDSSSSDEKLDTSTDSNISVRTLLKMTIDEKVIKDLTIQDLKEKMWYTKYYKERENIEAFKIQEQMWQSMKVLGSPSFLPSNMIIGLTVSDPHFYLPARMKTEVPSSAESLRCQLPTDLIRSPIWDAQIRQIVSNSCVSTNMIEFICVATMSNSPYFNKDAKIPIFLIQKPAIASLGLGSRIDIIIPSRWALSFWIALTMLTPLVGGLRETKLVVFESLGTYVPDFNDPDTPAYKREALERKKRLTNEYFSHSPNQRVNFIKYGIRSPFFCDWKNLTKGWSDVKDFYVLRHFRLLAYLRNEIESNKRKNARSKSTVQESEFDFQKFDKYKNCLVRVGLSMVSEGTPKEFAIICMPKRKDLRRFQNNKNYDGPVEKYHTDPNENFRKILFKLYLMQMKQLRRDRFELEKTFQDNGLPEEFHSIEDEINRALLLEFRKIISDDFAERIRKWYLPKSTEVRHSCDRKVMGYVTIGSYSLLRAKGIGIGYVTLPSLLEIIRKKSNIVLVRNTKDLQYRLARLKILVDINDKY
ncbi:ribonucleases P/MRP protein subunit POP1-like [Camponotus floridanus]|uniref:ribonucleases P/MRP protein subunit POP1-like n=1 Tax=Camponotus floridanus TaxID=104421 RepID=UPI000DC66B1E|nr:ribonucleases P/MRP protein subunit POP1-like [Camponotus floridanus]XP_025266300.1 ribonucleases P/MRP protein subunit POP1-like [Camponotus floridanus]XP_025266301.1 ribonucleases P/MRP protein subunit POP1-like [Camponotus floridanus]XP_025266302.1 ribonucleases P/MRP protein subunit POP1-like [Camponotus floridanus]XP_025266303.1 ribonucleases P/MRP protein subunit POP1-like [Camponotus floridanus]